MHNIQVYIFNFLYYLTTFLLLNILCAFPSQAQITGGANFGLSIPTGDLKQSFDQLGFGPTVFVRVESPEAPIGVGLDVSYFTFRGSDRNIPSANRPVVATTSQRIVQSHLEFRFYLFTTTIRPYLGGLFGLKYMHTVTEFRDPRAYSEPFGTSMDFGNFALSGGSTAGFEIQMIENENDFGTTFLNLGIQYLLGGKAEYLETSDVFDPENPEVQQSATNMLVPLIGITWRQ